MLLYIQMEVSVRVMNYFLPVPYLILPFVSEAQTRRAPLESLPVVRPRLVRFELHAKIASVPLWINTTGQQCSVNGPSTVSHHRRSETAREADQNRAYGVALILNPFVKHCSLCDPVVSVSCAPYRLPWIPLSISRLKCLIFPGIYTSVVGRVRIY